MKRLLIHIREVNWDVVLLVNVTCQDTKMAMYDLYAIGIDGENAVTTISNLSSCQLNNGITYSCYPRSCSVMIIGKVSSMAELANTFVHECIHLSDHICAARGIPRGEEKVAYAVGSFAKEVFSQLFPQY